MFVILNGKNEFYSRASNGGVEFTANLSSQDNYFANGRRCGLELTNVAEVDEDTETFEEKRTIYY